MRMLIACLLVLGTALALLAQPVFTVGDLDDAMRGVGRQFELVNRAVTSGNFKEAKVRVTRAREQLSPTVSFWRNQRRDDGVAMVKAATLSLDDLDAMLSELTVDAAKVTTAVGAVRDACEACHASYREHDLASDTYRLKPGLVN
jgi:hypothetical protein